MDEAKKLCAQECEYWCSLVCEVYVCEEEQRDKKEGEGMRQRGHIGSERKRVSERDRKRWKERHRGRKGDGKLENIFV